MDHDVVVIGGGPAGLALACSLRGTGLRIAVVERQPADVLANPPSDGREIALTHRAVRLLQEMGAWQHLDPAMIAPLRAARVLNGRSPFALSFDPAGGAQDWLGQLVPNHQLRRALYRTAFEAGDGPAGLELVAGVAVDRVRTGPAAARVTLADGRELRSRLLVAADSRFSKVREQLGITASINRLGRSMMVCRVAHDRDHGGVATEWFDHGQTIALLPLPGRTSSIVLTLPAGEIERIASLDRAALGAELTMRSAGRLGRCTVVEDPHVYPLATTFAQHFAATRAALIGDAAVGMHPVTAHGFNLGLQGQATLARLIREAVSAGRDIASALLLRRYEAAHRLATRPLYTGTNLLVRLYTDDRPLAGVARHAVLRAGARLPLARQLISRSLMQR